MIIFVTNILFVFTEMSSNGNGDGNKGDCEEEDEETMEGGEAAEVAPPLLPPLLLAAAAEVPPLLLVPSLGTRSGNTMKASFFSSPAAMLALPVRLRRVVQTRCWCGGWEHRLFKQRQ